MRNDIPNLGALQAFEASARLGSFTRAAAELALTHSAVGRQVAQLEQRLGVALFTRVRRRLELTDTGREYAARIRRHLDHLQRDTLEITTGRAMGYTLELAVVPTFATQWLIPRLPDFARRHPNVTVNLAARSQPFSFQECAYDAAIYFGDQFWPGTRGGVIFREGGMVPVCSPAFLAGHPVTDAASLARCRHLHLSTRANAWRDWYAAQGWAYDLAASRGPRYELFTMMTAAATAGLGIGLAPRLLIERELRTGQLVIPLAGMLDEQQGYYFAYPEGRPESEALAAFRNWILGLSRDAPATAAGN
ncbi:DNA-binding transcriptional regulator, LysR family [Cupriavidus necator]|uniref:LysR family transcriptional regulator n=1 Tax=Cupriavidus necator (strain ATCC 17699 / DSM 428 / KCTC 22496 / NCIMB 10442 / H16 / Stanier 337) TaxID=381666 RepID=Q0K4Z6_CUPNH|nr:LysR substrate-binding domain-containing protein [Cupriavidus necator]QCC02869.1 LysR family transcriptional regulator [Cupriavidus necator H16]QQB79922.1 LysR family transcriptional regulator [Cupriavidus necator]WKA44174.1 LysR substrate-binding domain-containing protein [Cupriavidus necator]CAJ94928.1 transcriptional regulator, LysR-family [Cupriavidus necator H16]